MGAGPAGLTAAWQLTQAGQPVVVWEADPSYVGGISRTVQADRERVGRATDRCRGLEVGELLPRDEAKYFLIDRPES